MNIIVAGAGKVGSTLAEHLAEEGHSVTIIDTQDDVLSRLSDQLDVMCLKGNCATQSILREAGVDIADIVIAATNSDEINILCCHNAHQSGVAYTVARVRSSEYTADVQNLKSGLGINMIINPELATAEEISRLLRFPSASNIDTFSRGRVEIVGFRLQPSDGLAGRALATLSSRIRGLPILFCAVGRGGDAYIPNGSFVFAPEDKVYVVGTPAGIHQLFRQLGRDQHKVRSVFIIGGGRISFYLLGILDRLGLSCKVVERKEDRCRQLSDAYPRSLVIYGDGTDPDLLSEERMDASDAFVALTDRDEDNLIISLYAHQSGVSKVIAKSSRQNYSRIARSAGLESVVSPKLTTVSQILKAVRGIQNSKGSVMNALYKIAEGHAEAMEFVVGPSTRHCNTPLRELRLKAGVLLAVIVRDGRVIIPEGSSCLQNGDTVIVVARDSGITDLNDIYADPFTQEG